MRLPFLARRGPQPGIVVDKKAVPVPARCRIPAPLPAVQDGSTPSTSRGFGAPASKKGQSGRKGRTNSPKPRMTQPPPDVAQALANPMHRSRIAQQLSGFAQQPAAAPQEHDDWVDEAPADDADSLNNSFLDDAFAAAAAHLLRATSLTPPRLHPLQPEQQQAAVNTPARPQAEPATSCSTPADVQVPVSSGTHAIRTAPATPAPTASSCINFQPPAAQGPQQPSHEPDLADLASQLDSLLSNMPPDVASTVRSSVMTAVTDDDSGALAVDSQGSSAQGQASPASHLASLLQQLQGVKAAAFEQLQADQHTPGTPAGAEQMGVLVEPIVLRPGSLSAAASAQGGPVVAADVIQASSSSSQPSSDANESDASPYLEGVARAFEFGPVPQDLAPSREAELVRQKQQTSVAVPIPASGTQQVAAQGVTPGTDGTGTHAAVGQDTSVAAAVAAGGETPEQLVEGLREELQKAQEQLAATDGALHGCATRLSSAQRDLGAAADISRSLGEVDQQLHATEYEYVELLRRHQETQAELDAALKKQHDMAHDIDFMRASQQDVRARVAELEDTLFDVRCEKDEALKERDALAQQLQDVQQQLHAAKQQQDQAAAASVPLSDERTVKVAAQMGILMARLMACEALPIGERLALSAEMSVMLNMVLGRA